MRQWADGVGAELLRRDNRIAELTAALKNSEAQQDWIAQQLHNFVTNKPVDDWQEAMTQLADYIEARKAP